MKTIPTEVKRDTLITFLTPKQRTALAMTTKGQMAWMRPIIAFIELPLKQRIAFLLDPSQRNKVPADIVIMSLHDQHDPVALISLLEGLPEIPLKRKLRHLLEERIRDRTYKKLIKKTLLQLYLASLLKEKRSVPRFLNTIESPEVRSFAMEQYLLLKKNEFSPKTMMKWIEKIPDEYTRTKTRRTLRLD